MEIYIAIITTVIAPVILFFLNRITFRRENAINELRAELCEGRKATLRLQILQLIHHDKRNVDTILNLLDEYHSLGGNSYITDITRRWKKDLEKGRKHK